MTISDTFWHPGILAQAMGQESLPLECLISGIDMSLFKSETSKVRFRLDGDGKIEFCGRRLIQTDFSALTSTELKQLSIP